MSETVATIIPLVEFLTKFAGAGLLAYWLLAKACVWFPSPTAKPSNRFVAFLYSLLYNKQRTRVFSVVLVAAITIIATVMLALLSGTPVPSAFDTALAAAVNYVVSQLIHAKELPSATKYDHADV